MLPVGLAGTDAVGLGRGTGYRSSGLTRAYALDAA
jgi:hypothetical protein